MVATRRTGNFSMLLGCACGDHPEIMLLFKPPISSLPYIIPPYRKKSEKLEKVRNHDMIYECTHLTGTGVPIKNFRNHVNWLSEQCHPFFNQSLINPLWTGYWNHFILMGKWKNGKISTKSRADYFSASQIELERPL